MGILPSAPRHQWRLSLIRRAWCLAALSGTAVCGLAHAVLTFASPVSDPVVAGFSLLGASFALSMLGFAVLVFCRRRANRWLLKRPVRRGTVAATLGGFAYGVCLAIGVVLAYVYAARPDFEYGFIKYCCIAILATATTCGAVMLPMGLTAGVVYSAFMRWSRSRRRKSRVRHQ
jgi:hypothetical protein